MDLRDLCARLAEAGYLHRAGENYHWTNEAYPADTISLRSVTSDNFVIIDITGEPEVIGEVDFPSALTTVHEKAIYLHGGQQYHVEHLDFKERKAYVKQVEVDYYTDAIRYTQVRVLEMAATARKDEDQMQTILRTWGPSCAGPYNWLMRGRMGMCWCDRRWSASRRSNFSPTKMWARASWNCRKTRCTRRRTG